MGDGRLEKVGLWPHHPDPVASQNELGTHSMQQNGYEKKKKKKNKQSPDGSATKGRERSPRSEEVTLKSRKEPNTEKTCAIGKEGRPHILVQALATYSKNQRDTSRETKNRKKKKKSTTSRENNRLERRENKT